eukprot:scaffold112870_cov66-Phaeocystis_antarctica.AAC.1
MTSQPSTSTLGAPLRLPRPLLEVGAHLEEADPPRCVGALPRPRMPRRDAARHPHEETPPAPQQLGALEPRDEGAPEGRVAAASFSVRVDFAHFFARGPQAEVRFQERERGVALRVGGKRRRAVSEQLLDERYRDHRVYAFALRGEGVSHCLREEGVAHCEVQRRLSSRRGATPSRHSRGAAARVGPCLEQPRERRQQAAPRRLVQGRTAAPSRLEHLVRVRPRLEYGRLRLLLRLLRLLARGEQLGKLGEVGVPRGAEPALHRAGRLLQHLDRTQALPLPLDACGRGGGPLGVCHRGVVVLVCELGRGAAREQRYAHIRLALGRREVQRRAALLVDGVGRGRGGEEDVDQRAVPKVRRDVQRRVTAAGATVDGDAALQQPPGGRRVVVAHGIMQGAAPLVDRVQLGLVELLQMRNQPASGCL